MTNSTFSSASALRTSLKSSFRLSRTIVIGPRLPGVEEPRGRVLAAVLRKRDACHRPSFHSERPHHGHPRLRSGGVREIVRWLGSQAMDADRPGPPRLAPRFCPIEIALV